MNDSVKKWGKWAVNAKSFNKCSVSEENNYLSYCITVGVNYVVHVKYPEWCLAVVLSKDSSQHYFVSLPWLFPVDVLAASWWDQALLVLLWLDASLGTLQSSTPTTGSTHPSEHFHPFPRGKDWFCLEWTHSWCPALLGLGFRVPHLDTECHEDIKWRLTVHGDFSLWNRGGHPRKPRFSSVQFSSVQLLSRVRLFATPWIAAHQASLSIINSRSLLKLMPMESVTSTQPCLQARIDWIKVGTWSEEAIRSSLLWIWDYDLMILWVVA